MPPQGNVNINFQDYLNRISQARQEYGQRVAEAPKVAEDLRKMIYGGETGLPALRQQRMGKVQELWEHDRRLAERYANPASEVYLEDPYARERARAMQAQATIGEIGGLEQMIAQREDVLGDMLERGLRVFEAGTRAKQIEYQGLIDELNAAIKIQDTITKQQERKAAASRQAQPVDLQNLYNAILQVRGGYEERANVREGTIPPPPAGVSIGDYLRQKVPTSQGEEITWGQNPDGSIQWSVRPQAPKGGYRYPSPPEGDIRDVIERLGAATTVAYPESRTDIAALVKSLQLPQQELFERSEAAYRANIAGQPITPEREAQFGEFLRQEKGGFPDIETFLEKAREPVPVTPTPPPSFWQRIQDIWNIPISQIPSAMAKTPTNLNYQNELQGGIAAVRAGRITAPEAIARLQQAFPDKPVEQDFYRMLSK